MLKLQVISFRRIERRRMNLKITVPHLGMLGGNPIDFLHAFKARENVHVDTALENGNWKEFSLYK
jgi:hypothetical protein